MPRSPDARHGSRESRHIKREVVSSDEEDRRRSRDRRRDRDRDVDRRRRSRDRDDYRRRRSPSRERSSKRRRSPSPRRRRSRSPERRRRSRSPRRAEGRLRSPKQEPRSPIVEKPPRRDDGDNQRRKERSPPKSAFDRKEVPAEELIPWGGFPPPSKAPPEEPVEKEKPSLQPSGKLLEDTNLVNGVVVKYVEPPEAKLPKVNWQLHPFRNEEGKEPEPLPVMHIHRRSCYLIGRDRKVVQFPMDHPSCSKQHAALQYRSLPYTKPDGEPGRKTKPYLIDLESANGTFLNDERLDPLRYYELHHMDEIRFGFSSRSFVILNTTLALAQLESEKAQKSEQCDSDDDEPEEPKPSKRKAAPSEEERFEI